MSELVSFEKQGSVGVITVNNPPVNALAQGVRQGLIEGLARGIDDPGVTELLQVVRQGRLRDLEQRHELTHAHLPRVLSQHVDDLQADRIAERLGDLGHTGRMRAFNVRVDDRLAAPLARRPLLLRCQLQIDRHRYTYIY